MLALIAACGQEKIVIKGSIAEGETFPENTLVYLTDGKTVIDSAAVVDGKFELKGPANPEKRYAVSADYRNRSSRDRSWTCGIIAEKGTFPMTLSKLPTKSSVEGSAINQALKDLNEGVAKAAAEYREKAMALEEGAEDAIEALYNETNEKIKGLSLDAIGKNAKNFVAKAALQNIIYDLDIDELKDIFAKCGKFISEDENFARILNSKEAELKTAEGAKFVDFSGKTPEGDDIKFSDYVGKGKWVLTDFWASWCGPCMGEIPNIKKVYEAFEGDDFMVLGVAVWETDGDNTHSANRMKEKDMKWHQIFVGDDHTPTDSYGIIGIPAMILFAPDGTIYKRGEILRGESMYKTVAEALGK